MGFEFIEEIAPRTPLKVWEDNSWKTSLPNDLTLAIVRGHAFPGDGPLALFSFSVPVMNRLCNKYDWAAELPPTPLVDIYDSLEYRTALPEDTSLAIALRAMHRAIAARDYPGDTFTPDVEFELERIEHFRINHLKEAFAESVENGRNFMLPEWFTFITVKSFDNIFEAPKFDNIFEAPKTLQ